MRINTICEQTRDFYFSPAHRIQLTSMKLIVVQGNQLITTNIGEHCGERTSMYASYKLIQNMEHSLQCQTHVLMFFSVFFGSAIAFIFEYVSYIKLYNTACGANIFPYSAGYKFSCVLVYVHSFFRFSSSSYSCSTIPFKGRVRTYTLLRFLF